MRRHVAFRTTFLLHVSAAAVLLLAPSVASARIPDIVLHWNDVLTRTVKADRSSTGPGWASRNAAIVHAAVYDMTVTITRTHTPLFVDASATRPIRVHEEAAISGAAYGALVRLYPDQKAALDAELNWVLDNMSQQHQRAIDKSVAWGDSVAAQIVNLRANDGASATVPYTPGTLPGEWQPTPPDYAPAWGANWGSVTPFAINDPDAFLPPAPPALTSAEYAAAYEEVRKLGAGTGSTRTAEQTEVGLFWAYDRYELGSPVVLYNKLTQAIARARGTTAFENARLFALVNVAMADGGIVAWREKFFSNLWRPITAIRAGDTDGNPLTVGDPTWEPLGAPGGTRPAFTPPFPAYISGHGTFGAAAMTAIRHFFGTDQIAFSLQSEELPGVTRSYQNLTQAIQENAESRVYLGVHWMFDCTSSVVVGTNIGDYVATHVMKPR